MQKKDIGSKDPRDSPAANVKLERTEDSTLRGILGENVVDPFDKLRTSFCWFLVVFLSFLAFFVEN
jgi:hypothetical protein